MNFFVVLMLTWYYHVQVFASPADQDYYYDDNYYENIDSDFCVLQELGVTGKMNQILKSYLI